jgi:microcystin-dependent protein
MKRLIYSVTLLACIACAAPRETLAQASEPFLGEIQIFPYNFCPYGWLQLQGQILQISQYSALFSLLGTNFGGDGKSTFALPKWGPIYAQNGGTMLACIAIAGVFPSRD